MRVLSLSILLISFFLQSCAVDRGGNSDFVGPVKKVAILPVPRQFPTLSSLKTKQEGIRDARTHARDIGFRIIRYDVSLTRYGSGLTDVGTWKESNGRFAHFGVAHEFVARASHAYGEAYNAEMDRLLLKRYGAEYRKYRKKMLAPQWVGPWSIVIC